MGAGPPPPPILNPKGTLSAIDSFCYLSGGKLPASNASFRGIFDDWKKQILPLKISEASIKRVTGTWYEWFIAIAAWNYKIANKGVLVAARLPNIKQFDVLSLYEKDLYRYVKDLRTKVNKTAHVTLITSNPDFVLISPDTPDAPALPTIPINELTRENLELLKKIIGGYVGRCRFEDIKGYLG